MRKNSLLRAAMILAGACAVLYFVRALVFAIGDFSDVGSPPRPRRAALSFLLLLSTYFLTIEVWRAIVRRFGVPLRFRDAVRLWSFSNLGRYVPGKVWQVVGVAALGKRHGITPAKAGGISFVSLGLMIGTGAMLGALFLPGSGANGIALRVLALVSGAALVLPALFPRILPWIANRMPVKWGGGKRIEPPSRAFLLSVTFAFAVLWMLQGLSFFLLATSWTDLSWREYPRVAGAYAVSYVAGLLALFAPGGIGVREGLLGFALEPLASRGLPLRLAVVGSRVVGIAAELVVLIFAIAIGPSKRDGESDDAAE